LRSIDRAEQQINAQVPADAATPSAALAPASKVCSSPASRLEFQAPIPEYSSDTGHLSSIHMTFAQVPTLTQAASPSAASDDQALFSHLERLQADFLSWRYPESSPEASDVVAHSAYLLSMPAEWAAPTFTKGLLALSESLMRFAKAIQPVFTPQQ
jgi:hypothetical protein